MPPKIIMSLCNPRRVMTGVLRFLVVFPFLTLRNLKFTIVNSISSLIFDLEAIKPLHVTGAHDSLIPGHARSRGRRDGSEVGGRRDDAWGMHSRCRFGPGMIGRRRCGGNHRRWWRVQHQGLELLGEVRGGRDEEGRVVPMEWREWIEGCGGQSVVIDLKTWMRSNFV